ncbi:ABC transporter [Podospora didyma]|uniref:ABC transporter n=1 Tax=Podospora didyma TaxID=330526 RepID=A0AAE0NX31_9PEZI|nr:ABC transporter [Podospora didyma]
MARVQLGLEVAFYLYPCALFLALAASKSLFYYRTRKHGIPQVKDARFSRLIWACQALLLFLYIPSIIIVARDGIVAPEGNFPYTAYVAAHVAVLLFFFCGLFPDPDGPWAPTTSNSHAWMTGVLVESVIAAIFGSDNRRYIDIPPALLDALVGVAVIRIAIFVVMIALVTWRQYTLRVSQEASTPDERTGLLSNGPASPQAAGGKPDSGWLDYIAGFRVLFPYLWPKDSHLYQAIVVICLVLLICQRIVNLLVPLQLAVLVSSLTYGHIPYKEIALYILYRALQGNSGALGAARSILWIPVSQSLFRRLSCAAFEHVLGLSLDFHLSKKIGEVTSALSRGAAMNSFLENFIFQVFPMIFDIFVAGVLFFIKFDPFYTIIVFFIMWSYIFLTIYMAKYRVRQRREMAMQSREMDAVKTDAIMAYETVQHNCAVGPETDRFRRQVVSFQAAERWVQWSLNGLNLTQSSIFSLGTALLVGLSAYKISVGQQTVAEFVGLIVYFTQLQAPLNFFGTYYSMLQNNLIEAERMLDLFKQTPGVVEKPDAAKLKDPRGEVEFENVSFSYQGKSIRPALGGISFKVAPGTKTAIVGESGSGKSTCLKLLFRFYDVSGGSIKVDGHDIRDLQLDSLRRAIGVVPQDTVLFNASIFYNLIYANPNATKDDVYEACKAANIHDRIMEFPDQYETMVGERGLKLSGGERQRVAIARAILKDARILLLDEATASLDSHTESQIQDALERVTYGRTTITIAHRLSTITNSDQIVVLHQGAIVERGTHAELLAEGGKYYAMWEKQTKAEKTEKGPEV